MGINANFNISLAPPGSGPQEYIVTDAKTGNVLGENQDPGKIIAAQLGWNTTDTMTQTEIDSIDAIVKMSGNYNIYVQVTQGPNAADPAQFQLDTIDPANPEVPIIKSYFDISKDGISNLRFESPAVDEIAKNSASGTVSGTASTGSIMNRWLGGNPMVAIFEIFQEIMKLMQKNKVLEGKIEVKSLAMTYALAMDMCKAIIAEGKAQSKQHMFNAIMAGVSLGISAISLAGTGYAGYKSVQNIRTAPSPTDVRYNTTGGDPATSGANHPGYVKANKDFQAKQSMYADTTKSLMAFSQMGSSASQFGTNFTQSETDIKVMYAQVRKQLAETDKTIQQAQKDKAADYFKQMTDMYAQFVQILEKMLETNRSTVSATLGVRGR